MPSNLKVVGVTISLTFLTFISLAIFIKALGIIFYDFFATNSVLIAIVSGAIVFIGIITGAISFGSMISKGKSIF